MARFVCCPDATDYPFIGSRAMRELKCGGSTMNRMIRHTLLAFAGLIASLPAGVALGHRSFDKGTEMFSDILALGESETLASLQYKESDLPHARQALLDLVKFINEMEMNGTHGIQKEI